MTDIFFLAVCPKWDPPSVEFFSEGDKVTLTCGDSWGEDLQGVCYWFMRSNKTNGRILSMAGEAWRGNWRMLSLNSSLVNSNVSLEDAGEYWCADIDQYYQCVSSTKHLLKLREPVGFYSTFYVVRFSVLGGLLVTLCVVVVTVIQRTRRGEQLSAQTQT
ncbi:uncharacterized protein AKAME5_002921500 [Lates japonicus]|uniref:Ig-like domain-containing protein n=1 Tax=Lates japonicus TaxID=270547 RepID=A0AAD3MZR7_LATJO|nr:uncharacterized protein AKAME5_002921500 [Lates japonicus]